MQGLSETWAKNVLHNKKYSKTLFCIYSCFSTCCISVKIFWAVSVFTRRRFLFGIRQWYFTTNYSMYLKSHRSLALMYYSCHVFFLRLTLTQTNMLAGGFSPQLQYMHMVKWFAICRQSPLMIKRPLWLKGQNVGKKDIKMLLLLSISNQAESSMFSQVCF